MSGHNKWSKIRNKKAVTDAAKSKIFSKMAKLIATASRQAKGDASAPVLRAAIEKAREYNMPMNNILRAAKRGGDGEGEAFEAITYETYGPGGSALVITALTTNRNKATQEIKHILSKYGFALAAPGSATWAFQKKPTTNDLLSYAQGYGWAKQPTMTVPLEEADKLKLEELINELEENDEVQDVFTNAE